MKYQKYIVSESIKSVNWQFMTCAENKYIIKLSSNGKVELWHGNERTCEFRQAVYKLRYEEKCKNRSASAQGAAAKAAKSSGNKSSSSWRPEKKDQPFYAGNLGDKFLAEVEFEAMRKEKLAMLENKDGE